MTTHHNTAELRKWRREKVLGSEYPRIVGYVYNDPMAFWEDGELGVFDDLVSFIDQGSFYLFVQFGSIHYYKCPKDEEMTK